jgi:hypothetical protein
MNPVRSKGFFLDSKNEVKKFGNKKEYLYSLANLLSKRSRDLKNDPENMIVLADIKSLIDSTIDNLNIKEKVENVQKTLDSNWGKYEGLIEKEQVS